MLLKTQQYIISFFNKYPKIILFFVFAIIFNPSGYLTGNEQAYFEQSYNFFNNGVYGIDSNYFDKNYTIILFASILNFFINQFGFYFSNILISILISIIFAIGFDKLFRLLKINFLFSILTIIFFVFVGQSLISHSWMIGGVEPKVFSYAFIIFSIYYYLIDNKIKSLFFLILATYFHLLIGLQISVIYFIHLIIQKENLKKFFLISFLYLIFVLPYLFLVIVKTNEDKFSFNIELPSSNWIYSIYRLPHHTAIFSNPKLFMSQIPGLIALLGFTFVNYKLLKLEKNHLKKKFLQLNLIIFIFVVFGLILTLLLNKNGLLGKFYLLRLNSLGFLFLLFYIFDKLLKKNSLDFLIFFVFLSILVSLLNLSKDFVKDVYKLKENFYSYVSPEQKQVIMMIKKNVSKNKTIILANTSYTELFEEEIERNIYVTYKNNPTNSSSIKEWYRRLQVKKNIVSGVCKENFENKIKYILFKIPNFDESNFFYKCGKYVDNVNDYALYELKK